MREIRNPLQQYIPKDSLRIFLPIERKVSNKLGYKVSSIFEMSFWYLQFSQETNKKITLLL